MASNQKHALITGSSRGIGRGIALALAEGQVKVAVHYYQNANPHSQRERAFTYKFLAHRAHGGVFSGTISMRSI